ncbi:hypothetical protein EYF80_019588 [Liparis tanakae]|uniref:Uncharacterized protein n=1 Tax=Liparis tanakae TaxID=230148 RepID=A0A4Z2HWZ6_9TELE|nr:hypothetical protein EYF80_019588 [Liparis tanakae]
MERSNIMNPGSKLIHETSPLLPKGIVKRGNSKKANLMDIGFWQNAKNQRVAKNLGRHASVNTYTLPAHPHVARTFIILGPTWVKPLWMVFKWRDYFGPSRSRSWTAVWALALLWLWKLPYPGPPAVLLIPSSSQGALLCEGLRPPDFRPPMP